MDQNTRKEKCTRPRVFKRRTIISDVIKQMSMLACTSTVPSLSQCHFCIDLPTAHTNVTKTHTFLLNTKPHSES